MVKLIILDIDGVMTDGRKYYNQDGDVEYKTFCDKDWTAIKRFIAIGIPVVFLTGDANINMKTVKNRQIPIFLNRISQNTIPKEEFLPKFEEMFKCKSSEMVYFGDDLFDIGIMKAVGHPFCTNDSPRMVKSHAYSIRVDGGHNAVAALFDILEEREEIPVVPYEEVIKKIYSLDAKEKF